MARKKSVDTRRYPVRQGYACRCESCEHERAGTYGTLYKLEHWCAGCAHGYLMVGDERSSCSRCGAVGQWLGAKPTLPFAPKPEAVDRVIDESCAIVACVLATYRPEHIQTACETDYFGLIATTKRLEKALADVAATSMLAETPTPEPR
jgi:hypothetical protein